MGNIPLPALTIKPPEQPDTLTNLSSLLHAKALMGQGQLQQEQIKGAQQENQMRDLQIKDQQTLRGSATGLDWTKPDTFDKWIANAQQKGVSPQTLSQLAMQRAQYKEQLAKTDQETNKLQLDLTNQLLGHIDAIKAEKDPTKRAAVAQSQAAQILNGGLVKDPNMTQMVQSIAQGQHVPTDEELQSFETGLVDHKTQISQAIEKQKADAGDWKEFQGMGMLVNTRTGEVKTPAGQAMTPGMLESKFVAIQQKQNMKQPLQPEEEAFLKSYKQLKELVPQFNFNLQNQGTTGPVADVAKRFGMTPVAFDQAAEKFWTSGQLPPAGRGGPALAMNKAIMNRAGDLHPEGGALAANSAEYKANSDSLKGLQKQFDSVDAFENTAIRNIDRVIQTGKDIPDLGARFANVPVRMLNEKLLGTPAMAKFRADLLTAQNESAKVLNSANANGVLSDSARGEVHEMVNGNMTYPAMVAAFNELKNDMGNRHQSYQEQIETIKGRLGVKAGASGAKTLSMAQIQKAAQDHGVSVDEATKQAKAAGYTVQ